MSAKVPMYIRRWEITRRHPLHDVKQLLGSLRFDAIIEADGRGSDRRVVLTFRTARKLYADAACVREMREALEQAARAARVLQARIRKMEKMQAQLGEKNERVEQLEKRLAMRETALQEAADQQESDREQHQRTLAEKDSEIAELAHTCAKQRAYIIALNEHLGAEQGLADEITASGSVGCALGRAADGPFAPRGLGLSGGLPSLGKRN